LHATDVQLGQPVERTPDTIIARYRANRDWRLYEKEWIYRNFPPAGRSWLDFGCGTGEIATQLALLGATHVVAVDVTPGLLDMTRRRAQLDGVADRVEATCGDLATIEPQPVDIVLSFAVLHHVADQLASMVPLLRRWLKPGGTFICVEPVAYLPWTDWLRERSGVQLDPLDPGERKLRRADLRQVTSGFSSARAVHFHTLARLNRVWPRGDRFFRRVDALLRPLPGASLCAGTVIEICTL